MTLNCPFKINAANRLKVKTRMWLLHMKLWEGHFRPNGEEVHMAMNNNVQDELICTSVLKMSAKEEA